MVGRAVSSKRTMTACTPSMSASPSRWNRTRRVCCRAQHDRRERRRVDRALEVAEVVEGAGAHERPDARVERPRRVGQRSRRSTATARAAPRRRPPRRGGTSPIRRSRAPGRAAARNAAAARPRCPAASSARWLPDGSPRRRGRCPARPRTPSRKRGPGRGGRRLHRAAHLRPPERALRRSRPRRATQERTRPCTPSIGMLPRDVPSRGIGARPARCVSARYDSARGPTRRRMARLEAR